MGKTFHLNLPVDSYFDPEAAAFTRTLLTDGRFDVAILSYVFYSRLLESMPGTVRKLIDTHDVFSDRFRLYRAHGQANEFFSTGRTDEGKALDRADAVLAIQEWDANHFRSLTARPVVVVGHLGRVEPVAPIEAAADTPAMLFVGGPMGINVHGVTWFIDRVLPAVRRLVPDAELWLVGGIGERVGHAVPGVRRLGFVDALGDLYRRAAVVINPQQFGTGLSIKSVDALLHGRPLVTTASGARGLEDGCRVGIPPRGIGRGVQRHARRAAAGSRAGGGPGHARHGVRARLSSPKPAGVGGRGERAGGSTDGRGSAAVTRRVVHYVDSDTFGGSEEAALRLMASLDRGRWEPVLLHHPEPGIQRLVDEAAGLGIRAQVVPRPAGNRLAGVIPLWRALRAERPAIFHAHLSWPFACKSGVRAAWLARVPAIVGTAQLYLAPTGGRRPPLVLGLYRRIIAVSEEVKRRYAAELRVPARTLVVVRNAIRVPAAAPMRDAALRAALVDGRPDFVVLTPARLHPQKGHTYLLQAAVAGAGSDVRARGRRAPPRGARGRGARPRRRRPLRLPRPARRRARAARGG